MAEHPAVVEARAAHARGDVVFQHGLNLVGGQIPSRRATITAEADDINPTLNAVAAVGWDLVAAMLERNPLNAEILFGIYVWRRRS